jgi:hypothetical protein
MMKLDASKMVPAEALSSTWGATFRIFVWRKLRCLTFFWKPSWVLGLLALGSTCSLFSLFPRWEEATLHLDSSSTHSPFFSSSRWYIGLMLTVLVRSRSLLLPPPEGEVMWEISCCRCWAWATTILARDSPSPRVRVTWKRDLTLS